MNYEAKYKNAFEAAENNDIEAVKYFIEKKRRVLRYTNELEKSVAYIAAANNNFPLLKYVLDIDDFTLYMGDVFGNNIMQRSIEHGSFDAVKYLVEEKNWEVNRRNNRYFGNTPVHHAAEEGQLEILKYLVEEKEGDINKRNHLGDPPLFTAAEKPYMNIIKYLFEERKADITALNKENDNIMFVSAKQGDVILPKYLLDEKKLPFDVNWRNVNNYTAVYIAARWNSIEFLEYFIKEKHADVNIVDDQQRSPLHSAAFRNFSAACKVLVEYGGANLMAVDQFGNTPAQDAIDEKADEELIRYLQGQGPKRLLGEAPKRSRRSVGNSFLVSYPIGPAVEGSSWLRGLLYGNERNIDKNINSNELDSFLTVANTLVRHVKRSGQRRSEHEALLSPQEIVRARMDRIAVDAIYDLPVLPD